jgi:ATP-dependent helicase HrpB
MERAELPIDEVLDQVAAALSTSQSVVIVAPPGAGKTTRVPQVLIDRDLIGRGQRVVVLEPRRIAARMAAKRIAFERASKIGGEVGYQVRFEDRTSRATRIAFLTEGILTRRIQSDPTLEGVGAVVLDEFHERSIHADLAIAFLREVQETVRPDLKLVVMSATLDAEPVARFLGEAAIVSSKGRLFPIAVEHLEEKDDRPLVERTVSAVRRVLREGIEGDVLVFLPGAPEIRRALEALEPHRPQDVDLLPLYGELSPDAQDRAVEPGARRKIILSTNIAESSLTIEGVRVVIDAGYAKVMAHDPALGIDRLELVRISKKSAEQRSGRAGRTAPGRALRLWTKKDEMTMPASEAPEIARVDLAPSLLEVIRWSGKDPRELGWFERPPEAMIERGLGLLRALGAVEQDAFRLTKRGKELADLPIHPRLAMIVRSASEAGWGEDGALLAAIASERDLLRRGRGRTDEVGASDLLLRLDLFHELERSGFSFALAERLGVDVGAARMVQSARDRLAMGERSKSKSDRREEALLRSILAGFPDRVARRRAKGADVVALVGGGGARMAKESVVKEAELLIAVEIEARDGALRDGALIRIASQVEIAWLEEDTPGMHEVASVRFDRQKEAVDAMLERRYFDLWLDERPLTKPDPEQVARVLAQAAASDLERSLPMTDALAQLILRLELVKKLEPGLLASSSGDPRLDVLADLCMGRRSFKELRAIDLRTEVEQRLAHEVRSALRRLAPEEIEVPSGRTIALRYEKDGPPVLAVRLQEVFGWTQTPRVGAGRVAVKMELLAPNMRPVQVTQDLESFWASTYAEVRNELKRRYPKHQWPEDPRQGDPKLRPGKRR